MEMLIGRDVGIVGGDGVQILYDHEEKFAVDLEPLIAVHTPSLPSNWFDKLRGRTSGRDVADLSIRQLVDFIHAHASQ